MLVKPHQSKIHSAAPVENRDAGTTRGCSACASAPIAPLYSQDSGCSAGVGFRCSRCTVCLNNLEKLRQNLVSRQYLLEVDSLEIPSVYIDLFVFDFK